VPRLWPIVLSIAVAGALSCDRGRRPHPPAIVITKIPPAGEGDPQRMVPIAGRVDGAQPGQVVVLFAKSDVWYVQPFRNEPKTTIRGDGTWLSSTHVGSEYAALLVHDTYTPPPTLSTLPRLGGDVLAIATVHGTGDQPTTASRTVDFSGYRWDIRQRISERGGGVNEYSADNVRVAADGALHLSLRHRNGTWMSAEVVLTRTLGYGTYAFVARDVSALDPAALLTFFTFDDTGPADNLREMDIQIQRPHPRAAVSGQYTLQPYYVAANLARFAVPSGPSTYTLRWEPGRALFVAAPGRRPVLHVSGNAEHEFTAGVPTSAQERVAINLCYFRKSPVPPQHDVEVVIERFQHFP